MSENEKKTVRSGGLQHLNNTQRAFVVFQLAEDLRVREIVPRFREIFPDFGTGVDEKRLKRLLSERFRKIRASQKESIDALCEIQAADILHPDLLLQFLLCEHQKLWWDTPRKILKKSGLDENGHPYRIYQLKTKSLLTILQEARGITRESGVVDIIPITRASFRLQCLQELCEETPRILLKRVERNGNKVYESQAGIHLAILKQGRKELTGADVAVTSIAHPYYRRVCLQRLWEDTFTRVMSAEARGEPYKNLRQLVNSLIKILKVAAVESKILYKTGCVAAKQMEHIPIATSEHREFLSQVLF